ncbi:MAG: stage II sporulation protein P [Clostridia bacterium]|nr:stage II sporulation protein P [Clostridia bacterium]
MEKNGNKAAVFLFSLLFVLVFGAMIFLSFFEEQERSENFFDIPANAFSPAEISPVALSQDGSKTENVPGGVVDVGAKGKAEGKIIEKYFSPYTANTSYKNVYLKNSTDLKIDIASLLSEKLRYGIVKNSSPQVLVLHTHATESFFSGNRDYYTDKDLTRTTDISKNVVSLGEIVAKKLNASGVSTLHDKTLHDHPSYNDSYPNAAATINSYKAKYKDLKVVIDIHRDAIASGESDKIKLTKTVNGKPAAQIMLVMGSQSGTVKNFPDYRENLKLAVRIQSKIESLYPGLARAVSLMPRNYNESLTTGSVLIEIGTDANSLEEAQYSAELLGNALAELFKELQ